MAYKCPECSWRGDTADVELLGSLKEAMHQAHVDFIAKEIREALKHSMKPTTLESFKKMAQETLAGLQGTVDVTVDPDNPDIALVTISRPPPPMIVLTFELKEPVDVDFDDLGTPPIES